MITLNKEVAIMPKTFRLTRLLVLVLTVMSLLLSACGDQSTPSTQGIGQGAATAQPGQTTAAQSAQTAATSTGQGTMTDVGTPRSETLIVQTFDGKAANPDQQNPLNAYAIWRGFRELGWSFLWEDDTATGKSYPELAAGLPEVLNPQNTQFKVKLRPGVYWSDGVEFTADDVIYTLDIAFQNKTKFTRVAAYTSYIKSYKKIDNYTVEFETINPSYDFATAMGVYTWGAAFIPIPKHVFEKQADVTTFKNTNPVTLGPYTVKSFDPNGFWQLWELRSDWQRSGWGNLGQPKAKYVLYKDFGSEETRTLAFSKNQYDIDTFMSPDSIQAAQAKNPAITTFSPTLPYHDMNDACSYGVYLNQQKAPLDKPEVRWALALTLNLQQVGITSVNGQFKSSAVPIADTPITRSIYVDPVTTWLKDFKLADGYQPFNANFGTELAAKLKEQGVADAALPKGDAISQSFGTGWWKNDPAQAEKLLNSVGIKKGSDGFYATPDGKTWDLEFVIPGDWNKVMQRIGFSIADSWKKAGFKVNARQVDNGEFTTVQNTNNKFTTMMNWSGSCVYNSNFLNSWRTMNPSNVKDVNSSEALTGNFFRVTNTKIFDLIKASTSMETTSQPFITNGQEIMKELIKDMSVINIMNIPTTIPTNSFYWKNYSKQDNFYAAPYSWWSSFKKTLVNIQPTGQK
jgi:peptide/nickel transport system substrate-binding protein